MGFVTIIFGWMNDQLLKMLWLNSLVGWVVRNVFGLPLDGRLGASIQFFIYDAVKIFVLLSVLIFAISYIQSFFPPERSLCRAGPSSGSLKM